MKTGLVCKLIHITETIFEDTFCYNTCTFCNSQNNRHLWPHVCWKTWIWKCGHLCMMESSI